MELPSEFELVGSNGVRLRAVHDESQPFGFEGHPYELTLFFVHGSAKTLVHIEPKILAKDLERINELAPGGADALIFDSGLEAGSRLTIEAMVDARGIAVCEVTLASIPETETVRRNGRLAWSATAEIHIGTGADLRSCVESLRSPD